jgi:hypothetical protein
VLQSASSNTMCKEGVGAPPPHPCCVGHIYHTNNCYRHFKISQSTYESSLDCVHLSNAVIIAPPAIMGNSRTKARRSGKGRSPQTKWSYEEEYTLFSWLDFTIFSLKKPDIDFFHETVINRLKNRWTLHQIERRLKKRWDDLGPARPRGYSWKQDIYHSGSSTLNLEPIHREAISKAFQLLGDERIAIQLATPDRGLRSRSSVNKRPSGSLLSKSLLRSMSLGLSPTPVPDYMPRRQKRIGCQSPKEEACIPESSPSGYSVGTLKRKRSTEIPVSHKLCSNPSMFTDHYTLTFVSVRPCQFTSVRLRRLLFLLS